jgi:hypothetical protein
MEKRSVAPTMKTFFGVLDKRPGKQICSPPNLDEPPKVLLLYNGTDMVVPTIKRRFGKHENYFVCFFFLLTAQRRVAPPSLADL